MYAPRYVFITLVLEETTRQRELAALQFPGNRNLLPSEVKVGLATLGFRDAISYKDCGRSEHRVP
jgi:hypothetical protein